MNAQIALEDDLLKAFYQFKQGTECDTKLVTRLLTYYKPHRTCVAQLERIGISESALLMQLAASGWIRQTTEELGQSTSLKLILSSNQSSFPYVNVSDSDVIEPNYTGTFKNVPRLKAIAHLKALCQTAKSIAIYDPYLKGYQERPTKTIMDGIFSLFPTNAFDIFSDDGAFIQSTKTDWLRRNSQLSFKPAERTSWKKHDRYLIIDQKVEVILSSGFDYLFDTNGDFTYVVRLLK
jgi:hypothetical protein